MRTLPEGERVVLSHLIKAYPEPLHVEHLDAATNYARRTTETYLQRLAARKLIERPGRGLSQAAKELFS